MLGEEVDHRCVEDLGMVGLQPMRCLWNLQKAPCLKTAGKDLGDPLQPGRASAATDNQRRRADLSRILASEARPRRLEVELEGSDIGHQHLANLRRGVVKLPGRNPGCVGPRDPLGVSARELFLHFGANRSPLLRKRAVAALGAQDTADSGLGQDQAPYHFGTSQSNDECGGPSVGMADDVHWSNPQRTDERLEVVGLAVERRIGVFPRRGQW